MSLPSWPLARRTLPVLEISCECVLRVDARVW